MPCIYETVNLYNLSRGIFPYRYIGSDQHDRSDYMGSNKELKKDIADLGVSMFKKIIIERFDEIDNRSLRFKEAEILQKFSVKADPTYYNKNDRYAPGSGIKGMKHKKKKVVSKAWIDSRKGWVPTAKTREKWSVQRAGKKPEDKTRKKMSESRTGEKNPNALTWTVISPTGETIKVTGLKNYCKDHNLSYNTIYHSRCGWTAVKHGQGKGGPNRGTR